MSRFTNCVAVLTFCLTLVLLGVVGCVNEPEKEKITEWTKVSIGLPDGGVTYFNVPVED